VLNHFPKYFTSKAISIYTGALFVSNLIFFNHALSPIWWLFGLFEAIGFFYYSNELTRQWAFYPEKKFLKKLFQTALIIRLFWAVFGYFFYIYMNGNPFEFGAGDSTGYHQQATEVASMIQSGELGLFFKQMNGRFSDMGYVLYLGVEYVFTGNSIFIERIVKAFLGAYTCVLIYKFTIRNFGEEVAKMAAIFCMLMPNLILYAGLHTKEVEMLLLTVWFMERADWMFRNKNFNFVEIAPPILLAASLFFFRTVLGATALFAMFTTILFSSTKVISIGKRAILFIWILGTIIFFVGGSISTEVEGVWKDRGTNQGVSMQARSTMINGNKFAKYFTGAIFAPMIFVIPFPTVIGTLGQENQQIINGGNFVKNVMAFFILIALIELIRSGKWRDYVLIGSFTIGYLIVVAFSAFAQAERFHQPAIPFELILAAFGLSIMTNKTNKYYTWWMAFVFLAVVGWSWFKLAGRGMS